MDEHHQISEKEYDDTDIDTVKLQINCTKGKDKKSVFKETIYFISSLGLK